LTTTQFPRSGLNKNHMQPIFHACVVEFGLLNLPLTPHLPNDRPKKVTDLLAGDFFSRVKPPLDKRTLKKSSRYKGSFGGHKNVAE